MCLDFVPKYIAGARPCERWPSPIGCIWMHVLCVSHVASCTRLTNSVKLLIASSTFRLVVHSLHVLMFRPRPHPHLRRHLQVRVCHTRGQSLRALDHPSAPIPRSFAHSAIPPVQLRWGRVPNNDCCGHMRWEACCLRFCIQRQPTVMGCFHRIRAHAIPCSEHYRLVGPLAILLHCYNIVFERWPCEQLVGIG